MIEETSTPNLFEECKTEVRYGETDQMGYAHHSVAVMWFELGRVYWLRQHGLSYRELEENGVLLPVVEMNLKYHTPGRFEDVLAVQTQLIDLGKTRVSFENRVLRIEADGSKTLLVSGRVDLACVDPNGKIRRVPPQFQVLWDQVRKLHV
jgi:acyl-CoA thioester hydrolase